MTPRAEPCEPSAFRPCWWLPGAHLPTIWGRLGRRARLLPIERELLATPDGDELVIDHFLPRCDHADTPTLLLLHGLEGSSFSMYMQGMAKRALAQGWNVCALNFRSCARDPNDPDRMLPNRRPRLYHSGETSDFGLLVQTLVSRKPQAPLFAAGVSLGGNVLLKWLGENPNQRWVRKAAVVSVPYDLGAGARYLERGAGRIYVSRFLRTLREKAAGTAQRFPDAAARIDLGRAMAARTFYRFDDAVTAPLHGFQSAEDYYSRSSSIRFLDRIATRTLCLSAQDDPFLPPEVLPRARAAASPCLEFLVTPRGGHMGFVSGVLPWRMRFWAEEFVVDWLAS